MIASASRVDTHRDVGRLPVDGADHRAGVVIEAVRRVGVADVLDCRAHDVRDVHVRVRRDLARDAREPGRHQRLAGDAGAGIIREDRIEHGVRDRVRDFVGVSFRDRFRREQMAIVH